jgi:hypothetical protein
MESFWGTCFGHAFSKAYQYAIVEKKSLRGLKYVSIKYTKVDMDKCITWPKKARKER